VGIAGWAAFVLSGLGTLLLVLDGARGSGRQPFRVAAPARAPLAAPELLPFGDRLTAIQIAGFAIALVGVFLCNPAPPTPRRAPGR